ncbi:hypothetical protein EDD11_006371 [Mortierella claussenii]|nr:hypothetical protein EDD11_006371 [Mortierella claussenii]
MDIATTATSLASTATTSQDLNSELPWVPAICQAFHPLDNQESITVLSLKVPPATVLINDLGVKKLPESVMVKKEAFFDICLDVSGSMAGSGMRCAKEAMKRLIDHLINSCEVPANRITLYLFNSGCAVRRLGDKKSDDQFIENIQAGGGTNFASVFNAVIRETNIHLGEVKPNVDVDCTLFFFTDGVDQDHSNLQPTKQKLQALLQNTLQLDTTVHTFGFTADHDAKLLGWLTGTGKNSGCFQYIKESSAIETSMSTTLQLLGDAAMMVAPRKVEIQLPGQQEWMPIKLEKDGVSGLTVVRNQPFNGNMIHWRECRDPLDSTLNLTQDMEVGWLPEESVGRILAMNTFIQHELLRLMEAINEIGSSSNATADEKRIRLLEIDGETEAYSKTLGTMAFTSARMKEKQARESCMLMCQNTRSVLQSFLAVKADAHKRGGSVSNTSLATFNALAYGQITEAKLKAKLNARVGKNTALFADLDEKVKAVVDGLDLDAMEAAESDDQLRELSCAFSTNSYVDALRDGDCLCMTLDVSRGPGAIADPSQLVIKSIFPTYLTSSMFTLALGHSLSQNNPEDVHGGFDRNSGASIAPGLAQENITAVMPLYINREHWEVAKLRMKPILGYVVTLDATGYTYSQSTTVPFLVLAKALESFPMTEFKQRQIQLILHTCDAIYSSSRSLRESTKSMVEQYCGSHTQRTVDVVTNNYVFLGHVICALRAGDITAAEMNQYMSKFETAIIEEQIRRDMSWRVSEDLMGSVMDWFDINRQRDVVIPGRRYREQHDAYVRTLEQDEAGSGVEVHYRGLFRKTRLEKGFAVSDSSSSGAGALQKEQPIAALSPSAIASSLSIATPTAINKPVFALPQFDPLTWELSEASLDRLSVIQNAISPGVDKIRRLLAVVQSPMNDQLSQVLTVCLGTRAPDAMSHEFFAKYSAKVNLATLLQAFAHTRNSSRRSVENMMTPFERETSTGPDAVSDEALQFLKSLYLAKMSSMVNEIVNAIEEEYLNSKKDAAASIFLRTMDLKVAAGVLIESKFRGDAGGRLVSQCAVSSMMLPREKIQMMLSGAFKGVPLFADKTGCDIRWYPSKQKIFRMFTHYHDKFSLKEWRLFHPEKYEDYIDCRYVIDGHLGELSADEKAEVEATYSRVFQRTIA